MNSLCTLGGEVIDFLGALAALREFFFYSSTRSRRMKL